eukprot:TRINITY_DN113218_c0_g1_i1.p1 TRINITY_DN113218_c0_g1~~TRINITY_DN113218_c0_g1_i1.p1  ORF type:complete len:304 (-),score=15.33 TRINITY_DN113218_c0_g1_i1:31-942(-)
MTTVRARRFDRIVVLVAGVALCVAVRMFGKEGAAQTTGFTVGRPVVGAHRLPVKAGRRAGGDSTASYTLHVYDHCPFCNRVELILGRFGIPYERVLYGYGEGAVPDACGGTGYNPGGGPVALTGKKLLPVLEGEGVPTMPGAKGMPESLEICSYIIAKHNLILPCDSGRPDLAKYRKEFKEISAQLIKPRETKMPIKDWANPQDAAYARWKYTTKAGFDYDAAEAATQDLLAQVNEKLLELVPLIRGSDSLNEWGWGMDDVILLPDLRRLMCVKGVVFPPKVEAYMAATLEKTDLADWSQTAC